MKVLGHTAQKDTPAEKDLRRAKKHKIALLFYQRTILFQVPVPFFAQNFTKFSSILRSPHPALSKFSFPLNISAFYKNKIEKIANIFQFFCFFSN